MNSVPKESSKRFDQNFSEDSLPDLDEVVLGALELFAGTALPSFPHEQFNRALVLGSGNAGTIGRIIFENTDAHFADESSYERELAKIQVKSSEISAVIISASGGKHAVPMARTLQEYNIPTWLLTTNKNPLSGPCLDPSRILVFPHNREPYTYNVSTYMGMLFSSTHEDPSVIKKFIVDTVAEKIPDTLGQFDSFYFILPSQFILMKDMVLTKFDELFGSRVSARAFTIEQSKHAKTVVPSSTECFISIGEENTTFGNETTRFHIPLPENAGYAAVMAICYYVIGHIQKQHPPYFKENIHAYAKQTSELFGETITPIVD